MYAHSHNIPQVGQWIAAKTAVFRKATEDAEILLVPRFYGLHYIADAILTDVEIAERLFGN